MTLVATCEYCKWSTGGCTGKCMEPYNLAAAYKAQVDTLTAERDAAIARAEKAEMEIADVRGAYARESERHRDALLAARKETGDLREGVTRAIGLRWITHPDGGARCPDDVDIVAACASLAAVTAERDKLRGAVGVAARAILLMREAINDPNNITDEMADMMGRLADEVSAVCQQEAAAALKEPTNAE